MESLIIHATEYTPSVVLDKKKGLFEIASRSLSENAMAFYKPVIDWIVKYAENPNPETNFSFKLEYYNTASSKQIAKLLLLIEKIQMLKTSKVKILWHYSPNNLDMLNSGKRYEKLLNIPFEFIADEA